MNRLMIITAISMLAGCTLGPNYQPAAIVLPAQYQSADGTALSAETGEQRWWLSFNDPAINALVPLALQRNLDLVGADASIRQARAQLGIIDSADQPQLNAGGRVGRDQFSKNSENFANIPFPHPQTTFSDYRVGFDASWEIDLFGHARRSSEAARARLNSIEYQRQAVALRVAAEVVRNVVDYRALQQRSSNIEQMIADNQTLLHIVTLQRQAGLLADTDVNDAQTSVHNISASLAPLQSGMQAALMALTVLTDQTAEQISTALLTDPSGLHIAAQLNAPGLPSDLLLRRPDLQSAERELAAATADIGVAMAERYPRLDLLADGGLDSIKTGKLTDLASRYWNIGPQITLPLLSGGRLAAQVSSREAARDAALARYRSAVLVAFADTETALIRYQRELQRSEQLRQASLSQQQQMRFAEQRYQDGDTNYAPVVQARLQWAQISDTQLASQQAVAENLAALYKSLGGGAQ